MTDVIAGYSSGSNLLNHRCPGGTAEVHSRPVGTRKGKTLQMLAVGRVQAVGYWFKLSRGQGFSRSLGGICGIAIALAEL